MKLTERQAKKYWAKVKKGRIGKKCWNWTGAKNSQGYGRVTISYKDYFTHRVSWMIHNGPIPEGMLVCHHCDNPACVRPDHLFLGTHQANMDDMRSKGRENYTGAPSGSDNGSVCSY